MVKTEHNHSISWDPTTHQSQTDYYMNMPSNSYTNMNLIMNNTNSISSSSTTTTTTTEKNSSSPSNEFNSTNLSNHKEIYPWMSEKKHGSKKLKSNAKNLNTTSTSSTSSTSGNKIFR
ncbi:hypothetical protein I4U23_012904 [Adineta vaga]|nr:hypothetical protein I4U23_012904 [Adineta vaga]